MKKIILFVLFGILVSMPVQARKGDNLGNHKMKKPLDTRGHAITNGGVVGITIDAEGDVYAPSYNIDTKLIGCAIYTSTGINDAMAALGADGGEVYLPEATYGGGLTRITVPQDNIKLTGVPGATILDYTAGQPAGSCIDTNDKSNITIEGITINGDPLGGVFSRLIGDADDADFLTIDNCRLIDSDSHGMHLGGEDLIITNNYIDGSGDYGIYAQSGAGASIYENNIVLNSNSYGMNMSGSGDKITKNYISDSGNNGLLITGDYVKATLNDVLNSASTVADIYINTADYFMVENNRITGSGTTNQGIWLDESDYGILRGNYTIGHDVAGIQEDSDCEGNLICGNTPQDATPRILNGTSPAAWQTSTVKIGSNTANGYLEVETDGTLVLNGTARVWDDITMPLTQTKIGANLKPDFDETNVGYLFPQNDAAEILYGIAHVPHDYIEGTNIHPHMHWEQTSSSTPTFKVDYMWTDIGESTSTFTTIQTLATGQAAYTSGVIEQSTDFTEISGSGHTIGGTIRARIYRDDNNIVADVLAVKFDFHYEIDTIGSRTELIK